MDNLESEGASRVTVQQLIDVLQARGWRETTTDETCHRLHQETLHKTVTISGKLGLTVPPAVLRFAKRYAQIQE